MATDAELLATWRGGDSRAGSLLFDRHYTRLARFFRNKVGDEFYDLIQQTMLTCVEHCEQLRDTERFEPFLLGVARNVLLHHYRTRARKLDKLDFDVGVSAVADLYVAGTSIVARRERDRLLLEALRRLPVEQQILIELYYWEELSASALAAVYQLPEGTIRTRLRSARQRLEGTLAELARDFGVALTDTEHNLDAWAREVRALVDDGTKA